MDDTFLKLKNVTKVFKNEYDEEEVVAVKDFNLEIPRGELVTLLGPSGCGKTTTLRMIGGFEDVTEGEIYLEGSLINDIPANRRNTGMVFQSYALFPHMNIFDNVAYGLKIKNMDNDEIKNKVEEILGLVGLEGLGNRPVTQLSGGQQQRVALARAIVNEPKVLLFDEPLSNLDAKLRVKMRTEIRKIQQSLNITSIYVTHDQEEAMSLSDRIIIMNNGRIEQAGSPEDIYARPVNKFVADFIGKQTNFIEGKITGVSNSDIEVNIWGEEIVLEGFSDFAEGDKVILVVRPEMIELNQKGVKGFKGKINLVTYLGSEVIYEIKSHDRIFTVQVSNPLRQGIYNQGDEVVMSFAKENLHLIKG